MDLDGKRLLVAMVLGCVTAASWAGNDASTATDAEAVEASDAVEVEDGGLVGVYESERDHLLKRRALEQKLELERLKADIAEQRRRAEEAKGQGEGGSGDGLSGGGMIIPPGALPSPGGMPPRGGARMRGGMPGGGYPMDFQPEPAPPPKLVGIQNGRAVFMVDDQRVLVGKGGVLPDGTRVSRVFWSSVEVESSGGKRRISVEW